MSSIFESIGIDAEEFRGMVDYFLQNKKESDILYNETVSNKVNEKLDHYKAIFTYNDTDVKHHMKIKTISGNLPINYVRDLTEFFSGKSIKEINEIKLTLHRKYGSVVYEITKYEKQTN